MTGHLATLCPVNEQITRMFEAASRRTVAVRTADGKPLARLKLLHAAAVAAAGIVMAPRLTATAALGAMFKGLRLEVEEQVDQQPAAA